ncbi:hypothetical protein LTR37_007471 [Vermiconidia calcicola]|uniref:Uncharacterized protein n=1 Tax=Vermiconidia calcicola TaxID=1690605 RepID=A0ACC3NF82_9PEZI|nr:hypothetical protein LTR37_007471 [Vermiconidia calcicola]
MSGDHNSWYLDRTRLAQPNLLGQTNLQYNPQDIMRRAPGYIPYQSMADTSCRYAYNAASGRAYPRQALPGRSDRVSDAQWAHDRPRNHGHNETVALGVRGMTDQPGYDWSWFNQRRGVRSV